LLFEKTGVPVRSANRRVLPRAREPRTASRENRRPLGFVKPLDRLLDGLRRRSGCSVGDDLVRDRDALLVDEGEEHVDRKLQEHRSRPPGGRDADRLGRQVRDALGVGHPMGPLGDGSDHRDLIDPSLERQRLGLAKRRGPRDEERRNAIEVGIRDGRDDVRHARTGRHDGDAQLSRRSRPAVRGVSGSLLVAGVDEAHARIGGGLQDRVQMSPVECEESVDSRLLEYADEQRAAVDPGHRLPPPASSRPAVRPK
jgi:hypothetical protein